MPIDPDDADTHMLRDLLALNPKGNNARGYNTVALLIEALEEVARTPAERAAERATRYARLGRGLLRASGLADQLEIEVARLQKGRAAAEFTHDRPSVAAAARRLGLEAGALLAPLLRADVPAQGWREMRVSSEIAAAMFTGSDGVERGIAIAISMEGNWTERLRLRAGHPRVDRVAPIRADASGSFRQARVPAAFHRALEAALLDAIRQVLPEAAARVEADGEISFVPPNTVRAALLREMGGNPWEQGAPRSQTEEWYRAAHEDARRRFGLVVAEPAPEREPDHPLPPLVLRQRPR